MFQERMNGESRRHLTPLPIPLNLPTVRMSPSEQARHAVLATAGVRLSLRLQVLILIRAGGRLI